jgi:hypothetical protein
LPVDIQQGCSHLLRNRAGADLFGILLYKLGEKPQVAGNQSGGVSLPAALQNQQAERQKAAGKEQQRRDQRVSLGCFCCSLLSAPAIEPASRRTRGSTQMKMKVTSVHAFDARVLLLTASCALPAVT